MTPFKFVIEHCTGDTVCIRVYYVYGTCVVMRYLVHVTLQCNLIPHLSALGCVTCTKYLITTLVPYT